MKRVFIVLLSLLPLTLYADTFVEGKDYQRIVKTHLVPKADGQTVTEFFSYGCPWCYKLEAPLEAWRKTLPNTVTFSRVPVVFEPGWDMYAKAYYTAKTLNLSNKVTPALFEAIQEKHQSLKTAPKMIAFFVAQGVKAPVAKSAFTSSPAIEAQVKQGMQLMQAFAVNAVPTLIINNTYRVDLPMAQGDEERFFKIADYLLTLDKSKSTN